MLLTDADRFEFDEEDRGLVAATGFELVEVAGHDAATIAAHGRDAEAVFVYHAKLTAELIAQLPACRVLARCGVGYDNIDVAAAREAGMEVVYVPDYGIDDVADHALALLLACARRVVASDAAMRAGRWPSYAELGTMHRLRGRTLGLVGFGRIARSVAQRAVAFGLRVQAYDPNLEAETFDAAGVRSADSLGELLETSDVVSLHVPLTRATRRLLGPAELSRLPRHALLVNSSRGELVDEDALVAALDDDRLAGAALDVYESEPLGPRSPLLRRPNVVLTPHSAAFSEEALTEVRRRALEDTVRLLTGERPRNPVPA